MHLNVGEKHWEIPHTHLLHVKSVTSIYQSSKKETSEWAPDTSLIVYSYAHPSAGVRVSNIGPVRPESNPKGLELTSSNRTSSERE